MATYFFETITAARALCFAAKDGDPGTGGGGGKKPDDKPEASKSAVEQANATVDPKAKDAITEAEKPAADGEGAAFADLAEANAEIDRIAAELAQVKAAHEDEAATLRAALQAADQRHEDLKTLMISGASGAEIAEATAGAADDEDDGLVEVRVKSPMIVTPVMPADYDPHYDGPIPPAVSLVRGLNRVPAHIADHWLVKGNLESE
jgi:hypothetical protein